MPKKVKKAKKRNIQPVIEAMRTLRDYCSTRRSCDGCPMQWNCENTDRWDVADWGLNAGDKNKEL